MTAVSGDAYLLVNYSAVTADRTTMAHLDLTVGEPKVTLGGTVMTGDESGRRCVGTVAHVDDRVVTVLLDAAEWGNFS